jgi:hypothetical protein
MHNMMKKINHVWLFFTDRCNLACGYCFYKYKTRQQVMTQKTFENVLRYIRPAAPVEFIFSGGEPLMEAQRLQQMITIIRQEGLGLYLSVQTNATLLNESLMEFFLRHEVNLEFGIDGDQATTQSNRFQSSNVGFADLVRGVKLAMGFQGSLTATMTVYPSHAMKLLENLKYLGRMGLKSVEVHPAFLEAWDRESSNIFLDQYRQACAWELKDRLRGLIGRGYSESSRGIWDLLALPNGKVLANWTFLSFPEEVREHFYLMDFGQSFSGEFLLGAKPYFEALEGHVLRHPNCSYRSISNFNALQAVKTPAGRRYEQHVTSYISLCEAIERIDHKIMMKCA